MLLFWSGIWACHFISVAFSTVTGDYWKTTSLRSMGQPELTESSAKPEIIDTHMEEEFELEVGIGGAVDIYDDMLISREVVSEKEEFSKRKENRSSQYPLDLNPPEKEKSVIPPAPALKFNCLIGNLTWWTSEDDVRGVLRSVGVYDCIRIKFFENRLSGLSKGYCSCSVKSNESLKLIHDNLSKQEVNGHRPQVQHETTESVAYFESQDISKRKCTPNEEFSDVTPISSLGGFNGPRFAQKFSSNRNPLLHCPQNGGFRFVAYSPGFRQRGYYQQPPSYRGLQTPWNYSLNGQYRHPQLQQRQGQLSGGSVDTQKANVTITKLSPPEAPSSPIHAPGTSPISAVITPSRPFGLKDRPLASSTPPEPHFNPDFLRRGLIPSVGPILSPLVTHSQDPGMSKGKKLLISQSSPHKLTPDEYQEVMSKNRMVASSAISHAVKEATSGQFTDAVETLAMAISLLRQSKVASDDRVKILISSLQDTREGIESRTCEQQSYRRGRSVSRRRSSRSCDRRRSHSRHRRHSSPHYSRSHVRRDFRERHDMSEREYRRERGEYVPYLVRDCERSRSPHDYSEYRATKRSPASDRRRSERDRLRHEDSFSARRLDGI